MRLIDADAILNETGNFYCFNGSDKYYHESVIANAPTIDAPRWVRCIDALPVVHGEWVKINHWYYCSECGSEMLFTGTFDEDQRYCYSCGAKMDGKRKENADL